MTRSLVMSLVVLLAACAPADGGSTVPGMGGSAAPSFAPSPSAPSPSLPAPPESPLAEVLLFVPPNVTQVEFFDWAGLKVQKGFAELTSAATELERGKVWESLTSPIAPDQPQRRETEYLPGTGYSVVRTILVEQWGFDAYDLVWEANIEGRSEPLIHFNFLRLRADFDFAALRSRFEERGYREETYGNATMWTHAMSMEPWAIVSGQTAMLNVAVVESTRTLILGGVESGRAREGMMAVLDAAANPALAASVRGPFETAGRALDQPIAATLRTGIHLCTEMDPANNPQFPAAVVEEIRAVAPLHLYEAFGLGYSRAHDPIGRFVFVYSAAADAESDLAGRESLTRTGTMIDQGRPYSELLTVERAEVAGAVLMIGVTPTNDMPRNLFLLVARRSLSFAACIT